MKTMKNKLAALLCVASSTLALSSVAEATHVGNLYGRIAGGYIFSDNMTFDVDAVGSGQTIQQRYNKAKTKAGFSGEVAFGYNFKASVNRFPVVRGELAFGYKNRKVDDKNANYRAFQPAALAGNVAVDATVQSFVVMANLYLDLVEYYRFVPYIGFGVGGSFNKISQLKGDIVAPAGAPVVQERYNGRTQGSLAWQLTAGTAYKITKDWAIDVYYRYSDLGKVKTQDNAANANINDPAIAKMNNHEIMFGVRYTF